MVKREASLLGINKAAVAMIGLLDLSHGTVGLYRHFKKSISDHGVPGCSSKANGTKSQKEHLKNNLRRTI
jgi:hypothetical protein